MVGDVVGDPGLDVLERLLPGLIKQNSADFVMVNGENAAGGFGLSLATLERILAAGADVVSGGNHVWEKREFWPVLDTNERVLRPMNYPDSPGRGWLRLEKPSPWGTPVTWLAVNLQGRELMTPLDCPFKAFDALEAGPENPLILVDFHAESSREKEALAYHLDGRACVVAGTHTHVQTADERVLPKGTAYITDLGMTGVTDGIIGMDRKICLDRARNQVLYRMEVASVNKESQTAVQGIIAEIDAETRKAVSIKRFSATAP
ncbi:MAG: YmdB family metallophosphoesterase [Treponema sp.]|jgi:metallophosphoesterase (TIGR00282 family)|nr:YmdB family metallophosphoesterase [Treponema sp.]